MIYGQVERTTAMDYVLLVKPDWITSRIGQQAGLDSKLEWTMIEAFNEFMFSMFYLTSRMVHGSGVGVTAESTFGTMLSLLEVGYFRLLLWR